MKKLKLMTPSMIVVLLCALCAVNTSIAQTTLSFKSSVQYGSQENNFYVLISTDFDGNYDQGSVQKATWTDITKEFTLASDKEFVESGQVDISKWTKPGQPVYVAFKYLGQESAKPTQRSWAFSEVTVAGKRVPSKNFTVVDAADNKEGATWVKSTSWTRFRSNLSKIKSESWAIAKVLNESGK